MIYDYKCSKCKENWEELLPVSKMEKPLRKKCPKCGAKEGSVYRYFPSAPAVKVDANFKISEPHNEGGFQDRIRQMVETPGIKGTPEAETLKAKHLS